MNTLSTQQSLHPMQWISAIAVTLLAVVGIAAITGVLPIAKSAAPDAPAAVQAVAATPAPAAPLAAAAPQVIVKHIPVPVEHRRIARTEYAPLARNDTMPTAYVPPAVCRDCGRIESVQRIVRDGEGSGVGAVAGGVLGGALGNGVGQGNGRAVATVAGLIGGAMLGNHVEKSQKQLVSYQTTVRFEDGSSRVFTNSNEPGWHEGERVRVSDGMIQSN